MIAQVMPLPHSGIAGFAYQIDLWKSTNREGLMKKGLTLATAAAAVMAFDWLTI